MRARADDVLRPSGALARLDDLAVFVAGWQRTRDTVDPHARPALIFAADHGVAAAGDVSAYPTAGHRGDARRVHAAAGDDQRARPLGRAPRSTAVDVGVGRPTGDIRVEPALDAERFDAVVAAAVAAVDALDTDLLVLGEMGIGNTTVAAALANAILGGDAADWVGRGTGVDDDGLARKRDAVATAAARGRGARRPDRRDARGRRRRARRDGGRVRRGPPAVDPRAARRLRRAPRRCCRCTPQRRARSITASSGTARPSPGTADVLEHLGLQPLLDLGMRLGEGSGAMAAVPLVRMACAAVVEVPTFAEWFGG